jgi:hypothetical protein
MTYDVKNYTMQDGDVTHIGGSLIFDAGGKLFDGATDVTAILSGAVTEQTAEADLVVVTTITGTDTVNAANTLAELRAIEGKINAILAKLRLANIIA